jgi:chromosome segregation ATPase
MRSDLQQLGESLNQRLDVVASGIQAESRRLQAQFDAQNKRQQELTRSVDILKSSLEGEVHAVGREVESVKSDTKGALDEMLARETARSQWMKDLRLETAQAKKALDEYAGRTYQEIRDLQQAVATLSTRLDKLPVVVNQVISQLQALTQTLVSGYRLEEAALRDRLKAVEQVLRQLEPPPVHTSQVGAPVVPKP